VYFSEHSGGVGNNFFWPWPSAAGHIIISRGLVNMIDQADGWQGLPSADIISHRQAKFAAATSSSAQNERAFATRHSPGDCIRAYTSRLPKLAVLLAKRMVQASDNSQPPPSAKPLIAAMGWFPNVSRR